MPLAIARYAISLLTAFFVVFSLFYLMQYLVTTPDRTLDEESVGRPLKFIRVPEAEEIAHKEPSKKPPPADEPPLELLLPQLDNINSRTDIISVSAVDEPPLELLLPQLDTINPKADTFSVSAVKVTTNIEMDKGGFGLSNDGKHLPIVKVRPIYPNRALSRGIEGYVIVGFTVTRQGTTRDVVVVESKPEGIFDSVAVQAAMRFKYKPRVIDGKPIEVPGVQNKIIFEIED